jgi:hypothetical protein
MPGMMEYPKGYFVSIGGADNKGDAQNEEKENRLAFVYQQILSRAAILLREPRCLALLRKLL